MKSFMMPITMILVLMGGFVLISGVFFYKRKNIPYYLFIIGTLFVVLAMLVETHDYLAILGCILPMMFGFIGLLYIANSIVNPKLAKWLQEHTKRNK